MISFENFEGSGGVWQPSVEFYNNAVRIIYADEEGIYYDKVK